MRGLLIIALVVAAVIVALALALPTQFERLDADSVASLAALTAFAAAIALFWSGRPVDQGRTAPSIWGAPRPHSWVQGLTYAVIWATLLLVVAAAYSFADWTGKLGALIGALLR